MSTKEPSALRRSLLCINCNIRVNTLRRFVVMELDTRIISVISSWISPLIITDDDCICEACWEIVNEAVNDSVVLDSSGEQSAGSSHQGHRLVCILCGLSLLRRRSDLVLRGNASDLERNIADIVQAGVSQREITSSDRVCHPCWLKSKRSAVQAQQINAQSLTPEHANEVKQEPEENQQQTIKAEENTSPDIPDAPVQQIFLPNYRRAANTASRCLFPDCTEDNLHTVSDAFKATILWHHNYYIPVLARICMKHLRGNDWDTLYNSSNSISTFNVHQIEHVFSFFIPSKK